MFAATGPLAPPRSVRLPELAGAFEARVDIVGLDVEALPGWGELCDRERELAGGQHPRRARDFVAGRAALRRALHAAGWLGEGPLLWTEQGRPDVPPGWTASLTHKDGLAHAVAAPSDSRVTVGIDAEVRGDRERLRIAPRVLAPAELRRWKAAGQRWDQLLEVFSQKEAIYKALHPHLPRYIGFHEARFGPDGAVALHLDPPGPPLRVIALARWEGARLLSYAVASRRPAVR